jgi:hypothetical protein
LTKRFPTNNKTAAAPKRDFLCESPPEIVFSFRLCLLKHAITKTHKKWATLLKNKQTSIYNKKKKTQQEKERVRVSKTTTRIYNTMYKSGINPAKKGCICMNQPRRATKTTRGQDNFPIILASSPNHFFHKTILLPTTT